MGLRKAHTKKGKNKHAGLDVRSGKVMNMKTKNVVEPLRVKTQAISSATEVSNMILRIDDIIASKQPEQNAGAEAPPGMGGMGGM